MPGQSCPATGETKVYRDADMLIEGSKDTGIGRDLMNQRDRYQEENGSRRRSGHRQRESSCIPA